jgi:para-nitrobenzyl esterase
MSVTTLLSMPQSRGLFRAAITQSGAAAHTMSPAIAQKVTALLAEELGVAPTRTTIAEQSPDQVFRAAEKLVNEVQTAPDPAKWGELALSLLPFMPTVDGTVLPEPPLSAFAAGAGSDVSLLTGTTAEEARLFFVAPGMIDLLDEPTAAAVATAYGVDGSALQTYAGAGPTPGDRLAALVTDWFFRVPAVRVAEARLGVGGASTWMYRGEYRSTAADGKLGAAHATEVPFVFDTLDSPDAVAILGEDLPQSVADAMHGAWVRFVRDLDPGWPAYDTRARSTGVFSVEGTQVVENPDAEQLELWAGIR